MRILILAALLVMAGCTAPGSDMFHDMASNSFMGVQAEQVPGDVAGRWTGVSGPVMMTMDLKQDGSGTICTAWGTNNSVHAIKYSGGMIYDQGGTRINVSPAGDRLDASYPYKHGPSFQFHRDDDLTKAAPYCRDSM